MPRRVRGVRRTPSQVRWDATTMGLMRDLGRALKEARNAAGLTQQRLAALAGVSQGTISWLEQGKTATISLLVLARAAEACGSTLHAYLAKATGCRRRSR